VDYSCDCASFDCVCFMFCWFEFFVENKECFYIVTPFSGYATNI